VRQVGYLLEHNRDTRSTKHKMEICVDLYVFFLLCRRRSCNLPIPRPNNPVTWLKRYSISQKREDSGHSWRIVQYLTKKNKHIVWGSVGRYVSEKWRNCTGSYGHTFIEHFQWNT